MTDVKQSEQIINYKRELEKQRREERDARLADAIALAEKLKGLPFHFRVGQAYSQIHYLTKSKSTGKGTSYGFNYAPLEDVLEHIKNIFSDWGLAMGDRDLKIEEQRTIDRTVRGEAAISQEKSNEWIRTILLEKEEPILDKDRKPTGETKTIIERHDLVKLYLKWDILDGFSNEKISYAFDAFNEMNYKLTPMQQAGAYLTYMTRYALRDIWGIPTPDIDPDEDLTRMFAEKERVETIKKLIEDYKKSITNNDTVFRETFEKKIGLTKVPDIERKLNGPGITMAYLETYFSAIEEARANEAALKKEQKQGETPNVPSK
jgi:hypothetical protein